MSAQLELFISEGVADTANGVLITLSLYPESSLSGTITCTTASGTCSFNNNFQSRYAGSYVLKASATDYTDGTSSSFTVTGTAAFSSVIVSHSPTSPTAYTDFTLTVTIKDSAVIQTLNPCSVTLTESASNTINGYSPLTITGTGDFTIYFTSSGSKTIQASCQGIIGSQTFSISSLKLIVTFPLITVFFI
jgi:hypothetical protein